MADKKSGCLGCLVWVAGISFCLAIVVGVAAYIGYRKAVKFTEQFAQRQPLALPVVRYSDAEHAALTNRIEAFLAGARIRRTNAQLSLTANDLNAMISRSLFSNHVHVAFQDGKVRGRLSVPFEQMGMPLFSGRYLNGEGVISVGCYHGALVVNLQEVSVGGLALPKHYLDWIQKQNFARNIGTNTLTQASLDQVARVGVVNGQLIFELKGQSPASK